MKVAVVDTGVANVASVRRALAGLGAEVELTADPGRVAAAERVVLPGVGAFAPARQRLAETGLDDALRAAAARGARLLGLCLGYQLLFEESLEFGHTKGLCLLQGRIAPFPEGVRTPHVGWSPLRKAGDGGGPMRDVEDHSYVYFVHSFRPEGEDPRDVAAGCDYGGGFTAVVRRGNVWGCQFHPEKSSDVGRRILRAFLEEP